MNKYLVKIAEKQEPVGPGRAMVNMTARSVGEGVVGGVGGALLGAGLGMGSVALQARHRGIPMNRIGNVLKNTAEAAGTMGGSIGAYAGGVHGGYASIRNSLDSQKGQ